MELTLTFWSTKTKNVFSCKTYSNNLRLRKVLEKSFFEMHLMRSKLGLASNCQKNLTITNGICTLQTIVIQIILLKHVFQQF